MAGIPTQRHLNRLLERRSDTYAAAERLLLKAKAEGRTYLYEGEAARLEHMRADLAELARQAVEYRSEIARMGDLSRLPGSGGGTDASAYGRAWGQQVAEKATRAMGRDGETRAVVSGSLDIPTLVEPEIVAMARPTRLLDLLVNRRVAESHSIEYYRQIARTNNAATVPDSALKPTSVFTVQAVTDHVRVLAHLSEETPQRLWTDHPSLQSWLTSEMFEGLYDALEAQIVAGDGIGENFTGILSTPGTTAVPFDTSVPKTLRAAVTALQIKGEVPDAWALNPADAAAIDLTRWGTEGGWLSEGYEGSGGTGDSSNIFGPAGRRVVSNSIPAGTAVLADWSKLVLWVRESANLAIDASGPLFTKNTFIARCEMRAVSGLLRPSAFAVVDLT